MEEPRGVVHVGGREEPEGPGGRGRSPEPRGSPEGPLREVGDEGGALGGEASDHAAAKEDVVRHPVVVGLPAGDGARGAKGASGEQGEVQGQPDGCDGREDEDGSKGRGHQERPRGLGLRGSGTEERREQRQQRPEAPEDLVVGEEGVEGAAGGSGVHGGVGLVAEAAADDKHSKQDSGGAAEDCHQGCGSRLVGPPGGHGAPDALLLGLAGRFVRCRHFRDLEVEFPVDEGRVWRSQGGASGSPRVIDTRQEATGFLFAFEPLNNDCGDTDEACRRLCVSSVAFLGNCLW